MSDLIIKTLLVFLGVGFAKTLLQSNALGGRAFCILLDE